MIKKIIISIIIFLIVCIFLFTFIRNKSLLKLIDIDENNDKNSYQTEINIDTKSDLETEKKLIDEEVKNILNKMSLKEKILQMFIVTPDDLTGVISTTKVGDITKNAFNEFPVGGIVFMGNNIIDENQITNMNLNLKKLSLERLSIIPFLCIDEEGGTVVRIADKKNFPVENVGTMKSIGDTSNTSNAYKTGEYLGKYLYDYGFNIDFAPVADVLVNDFNTVVKNRSFGKDANMVSEMVVQEMLGLKSKDIYSVLKHFPGHGATLEDSHNDFAYSNRSIDEIRNCELIPFKKGINSGAEFIMIGHISMPEITNDNKPASLSSFIINDILRKELLFDGIIITDAMNMGAISNNYKTEESTVMAINAGNDIILMPSDFKVSYEAVEKAVNENRISIQRIDESVSRIIKLKIKMEKYK